MWEVENGQSDIWHCTFARLSEHECNHPSPSLQVGQGTSDRAELRTPAEAAQQGLHATDLAWNPFSTCNHHGPTA